MPGDHDSRNQLANGGQAQKVAVLRLPSEANDLRSMEPAVLHERNLLRALINSLPDHMYVKDMQHRFVVANTALMDFLGVSSDAEIIGKTDYDFFPRDSAAYFMREEEEIFRTGQPMVNREASVKDIAGEEQWVLTTKVPLRDSDRRTIGIVGVNLNITDRKRDQEQIQRREKELMAAIADLQCSQEKARAMQLLLVEAEKLEAAGRLAAGVAHEVKNPLAVVAMGIEYLTQQGIARSSEEWAEVLKRMNDAVQRANAIVQGLLDFSAPNTLNTTAEDINTIIEDSLMMVKHEMVRNHVHWRKELAADIPCVFVDSTKIEQAFVNLFMNAIHAMPTGGELTVRTQARPAARSVMDAGDRMVDRVLRGQMIVQIEIEDTGEGIPEDKLPKVFEPFFTTKPTGKGTGLGLTVTKAIIELHGGTINIRNRQQGGIAVTLTLKAEGA